jgi:hypothetical protein
VVGEGVADAGDTSVVCDDAAAVAIDQAADEVFGGLGDESVLPRLRANGAGVFSAWAMLGK